MGDPAFAGYEYAYLPVKRIGKRAQVTCKLRPDYALRRNPPPVELLQRAPLAPLEAGYVTVDMGYVRTPFLIDFTTCGAMRGRARPAAIKTWTNAD